MASFVDKRIMKKFSPICSISVALLAFALFSTAQGQLEDGLLNPLSVVNKAHDAITKPLSGALGSLAAPILHAENPLTGGSNILNPLGPKLGLGVLGGLATGAAAATNALGNTAGLGGILGTPGSAALPNPSSHSGLLGLNPLGSLVSGPGKLGLGSQLPLPGGAAGLGPAMGPGALAASGEHSLTGLPGSLHIPPVVPGHLGVADPLGPAEAIGAASALKTARDLAAADHLAKAAEVGQALAAKQIIGREALAADALGNAKAEAAIAGADMAAHGSNNARSASLASNAYRQAKLAGARDRVNIAGTIQNTARISDAAIATHDTATKAEDSLLGSELAVDSAGTVLDSDAAYIPPVTNSLLRSLPYGRLGLRNILPKPFTYPSVLLPDVWLNGVPVSYLTHPLRQLPHGVPIIGASAGQYIHPNNGLLINGMILDPTLAHLSTNMNGLIGSSILPVLANGQLEAQDEVALSRMHTMQQQLGPGMAATYTGFNGLNPTPMLTGTVSDANLIPTTTVGTTYPIGSALVIEPRDSYFQDYIDNASSRQNYDERHQ